jgi:hypothetical protein
LNFEDPKGFDILDYAGLICCRTTVNGLLQIC